MIIDPGDGDSDLSGESGGLGLSAFAPEITAAGDIFKGIGAYMIGEEKQAAYDYNAGILEQMANQEMVAAGLKIEEIGEGEEELLSTQKAMYAKAGVTMAGSPTDVALQTATNFEFDKLVTNYNAQVKAQNEQSQANIQRFYGKEAATAGKFQMGVDFLKGAGAIVGIAALA